MNLVILTAEQKRYMAERGIDTCITSHFTLPYQLVIPRNLYEFNTRDDFFDLLPNRHRKVCVQVQNKWIENQSVALRESTISAGGSKETKYTVISSEINILVESFVDEKDKLNSEYNSDGSVLTISIVQAAMEHFFNKYNEACNGEHIVIPCIYDWSMVNSSYVGFDRRTGDVTIMSGHVEPASGLKGGSSGNLRETINNDIIMWRIFYNESKYSYETTDYKKTIIYAAIALETYINAVLDDNNLNEGYMTDKRGNFIPLKKKIRKLINDGFIRPSLGKDEIDNLVKDCVKYRNDIMHGRLYTYSNLRTNAEKAMKAAGILFEGFQ